MSSTLSKLLAQKNQLAAKIKSLEAQESIRQKKEDTRRKILAGAYVLYEAEKNNSYSSLVQSLDSFLVSTKDRKIFGLPSKAEKKEDKTDNV